MIANFTEKTGRLLAAPATHRNEFPARYSLAGCSPAEPASASLTALILQLSKQPVQENPANGNCPNSRLSQKRAHPTLEGLVQTEHGRQRGSSALWMETAMGT